MFLSCRGEREWRDKGPGDNYKGIETHVNIYFVVRMRNCAPFFKERIKLRVKIFKYMYNKIFLFKSYLCKPRK